MTRNAVIIYNPRSGAHRKRDRNLEIAHYAQFLKARGIEAHPWPTSGPGDAATLARRAVAERADVVIGSGGDGTLNEILQGMAESQTPLAVFPGGTANVLARDLGIPMEPEANAAYVARWNVRPITIGKANQHYFFLMAGIGLDAAMVQGVDSELKGKWGEGAYWISALNHLVKRPQVFSVEVNGKRYESSFVVVGNSKGYGGGFSLTPKANIFEPGFEVTIFPAKDMGLMFLPYAFTSFLGDPTKLGGVYQETARNLKAYGPGPTQPWVQVDGELLGQLPMTFEAISNGLQLVC
ncbi:MAG: diacylglycerol kinase family lipid kinase [Blastocatellia bacterium]|nr:diacylglycerol kinase family lipid kinase [Blastocatellia bacterium]